MNESSLFGEKQLFKDEGKEHYIYHKSYVGGGDLLQGPVL